MKTLKISFLNLCLGSSKVHRLPWRDEEEREIIPIIVVFLKHLRAVHALRSDQFVFCSVGSTTYLQVLIISSRTKF